MNDAGGPRRGRHSSPDGPFAPRRRGARSALPATSPVRDVPGYERPAATCRPRYDARLGRDGRPSDASRRRSGARRVRRAGPDEPRRPARSSSRTGGPTAPATTPSHPLSARHSGGEPTTGRAGASDERPAAGPSLRPAPAAAAGRVGPAAPARRTTPGDDAQTVAQPLLPGGPLDTTRRARADSRHRGRFPLGRRREHRGTSPGPRATGPRLGGADRRPRGHRRPRRGGAPRRRRAAAVPPPRTTTCTTPRTTRTTRRATVDGLLTTSDALRARRGLRRGHPRQALRPRTGRARRRRSPVAVLVSLLVLAGLVVRHRRRRPEAARADRPDGPGLHRAGHRRRSRSASRTATRSATSPGRSWTPTSSPRSARSSTRPRPTPPPSASSRASTRCGCR